ncbi:hypothetical protein PENSPDRAFT_153769 [Peniophora sp. CONT]|nr:hypothetical protein PENSPDRAFT_153769 [Peniophora sp. CONT]
MPPLNDSQYCDFWTSMVDLHFQVELGRMGGQGSRELQATKLDEKLLRLENAINLVKERRAMPPSSEFWASIVGVRFGVDLASKPGESSEAHARRLTEELVRLDNAMALAKRRRNMLSTASRLPSDVWSYIFLALRDVWHPSWEYKPGKKTYMFNPGFMNLSYICSGWRAIALSTPSLWTYITDDIAHFPEALAPIFIQRSGSLPLDLHFMGFDSLPDVIMWIQPSTLHRISSISLEEAQKCDFDELFRHMVPKMDCLKQLNISIELDDSNPFLPTELLRETRLTRLSLDTCALPWNHHLFNTRLTHLSLKFHSPYDIPPAVFPSFAQLADVLACTTSLQSLELGDVFPIGSNVTPSSVTLPAGCRLAKFEAMWRQMECLRLLSHLIVPPECTVEAAIWARDDIHGNEIYSFAAPGSARFNTDWDPEDFDSGDSDYDSEPGMTDRERRRKWENKQEVDNARMRAWNTQEVVEHAVQNLYHSGRKQRELCAPQELIVSPDGLHFHQRELPRSQWTTFAGYTGFPREEPHAPEYDGSTYVGVTTHHRYYEEPEEGLTLSRHIIFAFPLQSLCAISFSRAAAVNLYYLWDFLAPLGGVRRLGIDAGGGIELLNALAQVEPHARKIKLLPLLEIIHIHVDGRDRKPSNFPEREMKALVSLIKERRRYERPLQELVVEQSMAWQSMWNNILKPLIPVTFCDFRRVAINHQR